MLYDAVKVWRKCQWIFLWQESSTLVLNKYSSTQNPFILSGNIGSCLTPSWTIGPSDAALSPRSSLGYETEPANFYMQSPSSVTELKPLDVFCTSLWLLGEKWILEVHPNLTARNIGSKISQVAFLAQYCLT